MHGVQGKLGQQEYLGPSPFLFATREIKLIFIFYFNNYAEEMG